MDPESEITQAEPSASQASGEESLPSTVGGLSWGEVHMLSAVLLAHRSKHTVRRVGCVLARKNHQIIGYGFNGLPHVVENDQVINWESEEKDGTTIHAETNALLHCQRRFLQEADEEIECYVTLVPCYCCAEKLIQAGVKKVFYLQNDDKYSQAVKLLEQANVKVSQFKLKPLADSGELTKYLRSYACNFWKSLSNNEDKLLLDYEKLKSNSHPLENVDRLTWNQVFMGMAVVAKLRCPSTPMETLGANDKDPNRTIKALGCILRGEDKKVISLAYSGNIAGQDVGTFMCAEENCLLFANRDDLLGSTLYVTSFPCKKCSRLLAQAKIGHIYYLPSQAQELESESTLEKFFLQCGTRVVEFTTHVAENTVSAKKSNSQSREDPSSPTPLRIHQNLTNSPPVSESPSSSKKPKLENSQD